MSSVAHLTGLHPIKLVKNPDYVRDGLKSYGHLLNKYEITPTLEGPFTLVHEVVDEGFHFFKRFRKQSPTGAVQTRPRLLKRDIVSGRTGQVSASDLQQDSEYLAQVNVGTPPQPMNLDFDTGSADLWVWSTELTNSVQQRGDEDGHNIYNPLMSTTYKPSIGQTWQITYGDGSSASGNVGTDVINLGGLNIRGQSVELAQHLSESFRSGAGDGLLGLAFGNINTVQPHPVHTPVENMITQSDIPKDAELFTAYLTNSHDNVPPCYTFGYIDEKLVHGEPIYYTSVDSAQGFWEFPSIYSEVNGTKIPLLGNNAIADTGTTLALVDDATCKLIYAAIPHSSYDKTQGGYVFPANTKTEDLPVVTFDIGGHPLTIHKEDLHFADAGHGMVFGGVQSRGSLPFNIYGDTCLKAMYAIFDQGNKRFGFVQKPDPATKATTHNKATAAPEINPLPLTPAALNPLSSPPSAPSASSAPPATSKPADPTPAVVAALATPVATQIPAVISQVPAAVTDPAANVPQL